MNFLSQLRLLAHYNQWINDKIYAAAARLSSEQLALDRQAFFHSILGTLNHILVADLIWLKRFAAHPALYPSLREMQDYPTPPGLDHLLFQNLDDLTRERKRIDALIRSWLEELSESDLDHALVYHNTKGIAARKRFGSLLLHFFNHQTHHRGQATSLLTQEGVDVGVTDLVALIADEGSSL